MIEAESHLEQALLCQYLYDNKPDKPEHECKEIEYIIRGDLAVLRGTGRDIDDSGWIGFAQDLIRDIRFCPWYSREIGWHPAGFLKAGVAIANRLQYDGIRRFTGHSLGGVVAQIAAAVLAKRGYPIDSVVVFGSPKCGKLPSLDGKDVTLYGANRDPVTPLAPWHKPIRPLTRVKAEGHSLGGYIRVLTMMKV